MSETGRGKVMLLPFLLFTELYFEIGSGSRGWSGGETPPQQPAGCRRYLTLET
jgi:hypothetical protein